LALIRNACADHRASIIDVGGGASVLVDDLLADGFQDVAVLDISEAALEVARKRLGKDALKVSWIVADVTEWQPSRTWNVWHDRAVFHFLTENSQQERYIAALSAAVPVSGAVVMSTFALDGPDKCSGLPVQRYSPESLAKRLGCRFELMEGGADTHVTPSGAEQKFTYAVLRRKEWR